MTDKITREKEFHNERFTEEVRISTKKFYMIERGSRKKFKSLMQKNIEGKKILELGCGKGSFAIELALLGAESSGIDISDVAIEYSLNEAKKMRLKTKHNLLP